MPDTIVDGNQWPIDQVPPANVLDLGDALSELVQPITIIRVAKALYRYQETEADAAPLDRQGFIAPLRAYDLMIKPEAQRAWKWWQLIVTDDLAAELDDVVAINGTKYRVMSINDYSAYGFFEYHLVQDYSLDQGAIVPAQQSSKNVYFDGVLTQLIVDVSDEISDATIAVWTVYAPDNTIVEGAAAPITPQTVQITIDPAPTAGIYRLVGVSGS